MASSDVTIKTEVIDSNERKLRVQTPKISATASAESSAPVSKRARNDRITVIALKGSLLSKSRRYLRFDGGYVCLIDQVGPEDRDLGMKP